MTYDVVIIGGGLAGSTLAAALTKQKRRVLLLERETRFRDRVRGENMLPWGVAAARRLGILDDLVAAGGHLVPWFNMYTMGRPDPPRDLRNTTPTGEPCLNMYHPDLQEALLARAALAGVEVKRGAVVTSVTPGRSPSVTFEQAGRRESVTARLVVGADGRSSQVRQWAGFQVERNP